VALTARVLQVVQVWLKSVSNEGHFTREAETVRPYFVSHCTGVTETSQMALTAHNLQVEHVLLKSVSNDGHFTREPETALRPSLASHFIGAIETSDV
jgi:hypothetical protein